MPLLTHFLLDVDEAVISHIIGKMERSAEILNALHTIEQ